MKHKRLLFLFLFFETILNAYAYNIEVDGIYYSLNLLDKTAEIVSGKVEYTGDLKIPSSITYKHSTKEEEYQVISIGEDAFRRCIGLTSIDIPKTIAKIGDYAFYGCTGLTSIVIPENITEISPGTFSGCGSLEKIDLSNKITKIGVYAFDGCKELESISLPEQISVIEQGAFRYCTSLTSIIIPSGVSIIKPSAFEGCRSLTSISIPDGVKSIETESFSECTKLKTIELPSSIKEIGIMAFHKCESLISLSIPSSVEDIGSSAFENCISLQSIEISSGIKKIGNSAFNNCPSIKEVYCYSEAIPSMGYSVFPTTIKNAILYVPSESVDKYKKDYHWNSFKKIVSIGSTPMYTLTYIIDGKEYKSVEYEEGAEIIPEAAPEGDFSSFEWENLPKTMPDNDVTVNAKYTIAKYTLTYMLDGKVYKTTQYTFGEEIKPESAPKGEYATFEWEGLPETMPKGDLTVTAKYTLNKYTLTYMIDNEVYKTVEYEYGSEITPEPIPDGDYSSFVWVDVPKTMPNHDVTVKAKYTIAKYTLTYMLDGQVYKTTQYTFGEEIKPESAPKGEYATFEWEGLPETMPKGDLTVTAKYTLNKYTLTYMIDNEVYKTVEYEYGSEITPEPIPDGDYSSFVWVDVPKTMPNHDVKVKAKYTIAAFTITYIIDNKVYKIVEYEYGDEITPEPSPHKGYASFEWIGLPKIMPNDNLTVYAKYTLAKFKLTYMIDGEEYKTVEYEYGATIEEEPVPNGDYKTFKWNGVPTTMPDHDVTVTADYTMPPKPYKMIVNLRNGEQVAFVLSEKPEISFTSSNFVVTSESNRVEYMRADVSDFYFEEITTDVTSMSYTGQEDVSIYNMSGHEVAKIKGGTISDAKILLNTLSSGVYIIKLGKKVTIKYLVK